MKLMPLLTLLQSKGVGVIGKTLFQNDMPVQAHLSVMLKNRLTGTPIDEELPNWRKAHFQVVVRAKTQAEGEALMEQVMAALTIRTETQLGPNMYMIRTLPLHEPVVYPISDGSNLEFSVNFSSVYVIVP